MTNKSPSNIRGYFVIPVTKDKKAYLGVRVDEILYQQGNDRLYCAGLPNIFGGNADGKDVRVTLENEVKQESRHQLIWPKGWQDSQLVHLADIPTWNNKGDNRYYALQGDWQIDTTQKYNPRVINQQTGALEDGYGETAGDVGSIDLASLNLFDDGKYKQSFQTQWQTVRNRTWNDKQWKQFWDDRHTPAICEVAKRFR